MGKTKSSKAAAVGAASPSSMSRASAAPQLVNGFHTLPMTMGRDGPTHHIFLRADKSAKTTDPSSSSQRLPSNRTLFVVNLPVDATAKHLRHLFEKKVGRIENVRIKRRGFGAVANQQQEQVAEGEEEDKDSEMGEGSDEDDAEADVAATNASAGPTSSAKSKKQLKREAANHPKVPELHSLPSLNPRGEQTFLQTGSTAHVVFLEEGCVEKALSLVATKPSSFKWADPWEDIKRKAAAAQEEGDGDDGDDGDDTGRRRRQPQTALEAQSQALLSSDPPPPAGLSYFLQAYSSHRPSPATLKMHADSVVSRYTFFRAHPALNPENQRRAQQGYGIGSQVGGITIASWGPEGEPLDADGFTIVLPGGKYGRAMTNSSNAPADVSSANAIGTTGGHSKMARSSLLDQEAVRLKQEKKMEGLEDFYRFQNREKRKEKLVQMRKQFEEDREKVQRLKEKGGGGRRFRPY